MTNTKSTPGNKPARPQTTATALHARQTRSKRLMMDVARPKPTKKATVSAVTPQSPKVRHQTMDIKPSAVLHNRHPQGAKTLMRRAVAKPAKGFKRQAAVHAPTDAGRITGHTAIIVSKWPANQVDPQRAKHAEHTAKSKFIQHFAPSPSSWFADQAAMKLQAAAVRTPSRLTTPINAAGTARRSMDIFERAIHHATSHEQPPVDPKKLAKTSKKSPHHRRPVHHRLPTIVGASLAVLLIFGFVMYQLRPTITLRFATAKAGFHATLPTYQPGGFAISKFKYQTGVVDVNYQRPDTNRSYTFSQKVSTLNSQTVLDNIVAPHTSTYQTLDSGGRTIYIYGDNNAAWVDRGILYQITSHGNLSNSDVLTIARSI